MKETLKPLLGGIDSFELELDRKYTEKELEQIEVIMLDKTTYNTTEDKTRVAIRPNRELSNVSQVMECIVYVAGRLGCKEWSITRIDISTDFKNKLEDNLNLGRLFISCLAITKRINLDDVFNTKKGIESQGNLKIKTRRLEVTLYNCTDKNRIANLRIEFRTKDIRNSLEDKKKIENEIKGILSDLKNLDSLVEKVEEYNIQELTNLYNKTIGKKYRTFSEFVAFADSQGYIMTSDILKGLITKVGLTIGYKKFVENFRKTRRETLNFATKTDLKKLTKEIEKALKLSLKN